MTIERAATVEVVVVGDELLLGDVVDANTATLARLFAGTGMELTRSTCVGDDVDALQTVLAEAVTRQPRAVVVTGGLGPTSDDRTRSAVAGLVGAELLRDPALERTLATWYAAAERSVPEAAWAQADLPYGARPLANRVGSAPGFVLPADGVSVYCLPGVPVELEVMAVEQLLPELAAGPGISSRSFLLVGVGESEAAARLAHLEAELPGALRLSYLPGTGEVRVRLWARDAEGAALLPAYAERARKLLGDAVAGEGKTSLPEVVHRLLRERGATVAVAESLTGGALGMSLTQTPGASATFRGGVIAYQTALKTSLLGVDAELLASRGPVDPEVAAQMAVGVRRHLEASYGVATTGVAGPEPQDGQDGPDGQGAAPVGTVYVAVAGPESCIVRRAVFSGDRDVVRRRTVAEALHLLRLELLGAILDPSTECGKTTS